MKVSVVYHSADYDGIFCREIARKFLPDAELIGWDFGDKPLEIPEGQIYILDLPVDRVFGFDYAALKRDQPKDVPFKGPKHPDGLVWIDHHKSSIESHPTDIPGYRIDGVAACRLAWQYFTLFHPSAGSFALPKKEDYVERRVAEPLAVRLAGEYDVWQHEPSGHDDVRFQFGLDGQFALAWPTLLSLGEPSEAEVKRIVYDGASIQQCYAKRDADIIHSRSFLVDFEGLKFLALNTARCNSNTFASRDIPETGHDALMGFFFNGSKWAVSLYHAAHRKDLDLSQIAVKHGGGGHRGACGFTTDKFPF